MTKKDEQYSDEETARRRDAVIKHMEMKLGKHKTKAGQPKKRGRPKNEKNEMAHRQ